MLNSDAAQSTAASDRCSYFSSCDYSLPCRQRQTLLVCLDSQAPGRFDDFAALLQRPPSSDHELLFTSATILTVLPSTI